MGTPIQADERAPRRPARPRVPGRWCRASGAPDARPHARPRQGAHRRQRAVRPRQHPRAVPIEELGQRGAPRERTKGRPGVPTRGFCAPGGPRLPFVFTRPGFAKNPGRRSGDQPITDRSSSNPSGVPCQRKRSHSTPRRRRTYRSTSTAMTTSSSGPRTGMNSGIGELDDVSADLPLRKASSPQRRSSGPRDAAPCIAAQADQPSSSRALVERRDRGARAARSSGRTDALPRRATRPSPGSRAP